MNSDLTVGKPSAVLWRFCLPLFASVIFQQLYNIADSLIAGKLIGENALAAVGNSYEVTLIFIAFAFGCNIGCSVVVSRLFGSKAEVIIAGQAQDKAETVYVNLGSNHEVRAGDTFTVYAPVAIGNNSGSTSIGTLTVDEVQGGTLSLCKVKKGGKEILTAIQQGATLIVHSKW